MTRGPGGGERGAKNGKEEIFRPVFSFSYETQMHTARVPHRTLCKHAGIGCPRRAGSRADLSVSHKHTADGATHIYPSSSARHRLEASLYTPDNSHGTERTRPQRAQVVSHALRFARKRRVVCTQAHIGRRRPRKATYTLKPSGAGTGASATGTWGSFRLMGAVAAHQ